MLAKPHRLTKDKEFENVFKNGKHFFTKALGLWYVKNEKDLTRFGVMVSQKISKKATIRNKIKRRIREIIRLELPEIEQGYDIAIVTRVPIKDNFEYEELEKNIQYLLKKTRLVNKEG